MITLVSFERQYIQYWEAWRDGTRVMIHYGTVGDLGSAEIVPCKTQKDADGIVKRLANEKKILGYIVPSNELFSVIRIQYQINGFGSEADLDRRYKIQELIDNALIVTGNGVCDGGDIGSGTMNVCCNVLDTRTGVNTIIEALENNGYLEGAVVILETEDEDEVLYP